MSKLMCYDTNMTIEPLLGMGKIMPTRRLIIQSNNLGFKKQRKNSAWIIRKSYHLNDKSGRGKIMAFMWPNGALKSKESFIFTSHMAHRASPRHWVKLLQIVKIFKWLMINQFKGTKLKDKTEADMNKLQKATSEHADPKWTRINFDLLLAPDIQRIDHFAIAVAILLAWWLLCQGILFLRRFYYENIRK